MVVTSLDPPQSKTSSSAIAERQSCRVGLLYPKVEDWNWETIFYGHYRSIFNHCDVIGQQRNRIKWKNAKWGLLRHSRSVKVIEVGINRKPVCEFLLVINSNCHPISYRFGVIAAYCSNFGHFAFWATLRGLRDNVGCSSWAHWRGRGGLPISVNWTFFTAEALRAKIDRKSAILLKRGKRCKFDPKFQVEGVTPYQPFFFSEN